MRSERRRDVAINYAVPTEYEFALYYGATNPVAAAPSNLSLTSRNINPEELLSFIKRQSVEAIPESDGGALITDDKSDADPITFFGQQYGDTDRSDDVFSSMATRVSQLAAATQLMYLRYKLSDGSSNTFYRRYGAVKRFGSRMMRHTFYRGMESEMTFDVTDPWIYLDSQSSDAVAVAGGTGAKVVTDSGSRKTKRVLLYVAKTGASSPANVQIKNAANETITLGGSLATIGDFWEVDMLRGRVSKSVSSVVSNDIANVTGRFWGIAAGTDTITVTDGGTATFTVSALWLPRKV